MRYNTVNKDANDVKIRYNEVDIGYKANAVDRNNAVDTPIHVARGPRAQWTGKGYLNDS